MQAPKWAPADVDANHANALGLFTANIVGAKSASDLLFDSIMKEFS